MSSLPPLVSADWLQDSLGQPGIRVVDATWVPPFLTGRPSGKEQYERSHIPGAVFFDIDEIAAPGSHLPHMLPEPDIFADKVGKLGLGNDSQIIAYDNNNFFASARVWWMFRTMGYNNVCVLDGGYNAWRGVGGAIEAGLPNVTENQFTPQMQTKLIDDRVGVEAASQLSAAVILDARSAGRFAGTQPEPRKGLPSGHIPGSHSVPADTLQSPNGTLKSVDALREILGDYVDQPVITTCGSGVSAAVIALALAKLGKMDASVYDGSWSEWAAHPNSIIETS